MSLVKASLFLSSIILSAGPGFVATKYYPSKVGKVLYDGTTVKDARAGEFAWVAVDVDRYDYETFYPGDWILIIFRDSSTALLAQARDAGYLDLHGRCVRAGTQAGSACYPIVVDIPDHVWDFGKDTSAKVSFVLNISALERFANEFVPRGERSDGEIVSGVEGSGRQVDGAGDGPVREEGGDQRRGGRYLE